MRTGFLTAIAVSGPLLIVACGSDKGPTQPANTLTRWLSNTTAIAASPSTTYFFSAWVKTAGVQQANISIDFGLSAGIT